MLRIASASCVLCAIAMLSVPFEAAAKSGGVHIGARSFHSGAYRRFPWVGGYASAPYYAPDYVGYGQSVVVVLPPPEPPYQLTCKHSREVVTVPSEDGGTR